MSAHPSRQRRDAATWILRTALLIAAIIHFLPLPGVLGATALEPVYGLPALDPGSELLLRHRALVFGLLGAMLLTALSRPTWRGPAIAMVLASDLGFLVFAWIGSPLTPELARVVAFDAVSVLALLIAALASARMRVTG